LFLRVLGPLRHERDGQDVDIGGARLADVWRPAARDSAATSLHVSVSKLRRAIDPDRRARASSPLVSTAGGYALAVGSDATEVQDEDRRASGLLGAGEFAAAYDVLAEAWASWRGEPYGEVGEHSWLVRERRRCDDLRTYVAELHAEASLRLRRDAGGVGLDLAGLAERHPTRERLAVLLAIALYRDQRQDEALRVLRLTRDHLRDLSGLDPGPDFQLVEQLILAQRPDPYAAQPPTGSVR